MKKVFKFYSLWLLCSSILTIHAETQAPLVLVPTLNPERYSGLWYEIARYQHSFEKTLVGATAEYKLRSDGKIDVINSGFKNTLEGKFTSVKAVAWIPNPEIPAALKVKFFNLFSADYLVFGLDQENYEWAIVGDNSRKYLWLLARTPTIPIDQYNTMLEMAKNQGYDISLVYKVPQKAR